jgi:hypothetical protein
MEFVRRDVTAQVVFWIRMVQMLFPDLPPGAHRGPTFYLAEESSAKNDLTK